MRGDLRFLGALTALFAAAPAPSVSAAAAGGSGEPVALAVLDFDYVDTSGEPADLAAIHNQRLGAFTSALRRDLSASGRYRIVSIACGGAPCVSSADPFEVQKAARAAGARFVLTGGVHKMSSLIEWAKIAIADEDEGRVVFDRLLSFRGDNDEAWRRAESFAARQILESLFREP